MQYTILDLNCKKSKFYTPKDKENVTQNKN